MLLDKIHACFRLISTETSRKVNELYLKNAMLEAALNEARQQVQVMSTAAVVDAIKQNVQARIDHRPAPASPTQVWPQK